METYCIDKIIMHFKYWLFKNIKKYLPLHDNWEASIEIREDLIECHWDEPHKNKRANHCRIIPLTNEIAEEFKGYTIDVPIKEIRRY